MLTPIIKPSESVVFQPDIDFKMSVDGSSGSIVPRVPIQYPPTRSFDLDNLLRSGFSFSPITSFIQSSIESNMDKLDEVDNFLNNIPVNE